MLNKYQNVFRSRWKAVWWALGVCLTAYCTVPSKDQDNGDLMPGLTQFAHKKGHTHHADTSDPWAVDKPGKKEG